MEDKQIAKEKTNSVIKSAIYFATGTMISRVLGLTRDAVLFATYDKTVLDAFNAAIRLPNLFRRVFGEGALSACFIPLYVEYRKKGDIKSLTQLTVGIWTLLLIILIPLTVLIVGTMDHLVSVWVGGEGFASVPGKLELTIAMTKIMFPFLLLVSMYAFFMAVLNAHKQFLLSALAPSFYNLTLILVNVYCYMTHQFSGIILAWTVIAAGFLQFAVLVPPYLKLNLGYKFAWSHLRSEPVMRTLRAFAPTVVGLGIVQIMGLINVNFASRLAEGSVSYIAAADRLLELPLSLIAVSLGTVLLPSLSEKTGDQRALNQSLARTLKVVIFLCVPAAVGLWMLSPLVVSLLYQRGRFTLHDTLAVAPVVQIYCFTLISASLARIMSQAFYAHKNTLQPAFASLTGLIVHVFLAPYLMQFYGIYGLVASTSTAAFLNIAYLFINYRWRFGHFHFPELMFFFARCATAALAIVAACWMVNHYLPTEHFIQRLLAVIVAMGLSMTGYFGLSLVLRLEEAQEILLRFRKKLRV